ncbi:myosin-6-like [Branchiostoma floridae]|uniref:Myosin-6-like n=1 Tax=Branchiostoma floridae TaxID=7739 RepID=A0A9J7M304_BRAFL|nr:myosin-6-like [Branchiostoma floridae]
MALLRKFRESTKDKTTKVCLNTDEFMTVANMRQEFLGMRSTNSHLKDCVRVLHENSAKMRQEANQQQLIISSLKSLHEEIVKKKDEEAREMEIKATACSVVQKVMTQALTKLVAEKDDQAAVKDSMLSQTKEELALSNNETAKLREEVRDLKAELDAEQRRHQDTLKNLRKNELRLKEMTFQSDEDRKKQERLQELVEKMQQKINTYKTQSDEVRDLEAELDAEQRRHQDTLKNLRKNELRLKEMTFQSDEDRKKQERLQELVEEVQMKIKTHKRQSEASAASIADDLRQEQDKNAHLEKVKKSLEDNIRDFQRRLDEVETGALKAGKHHLQKLETKVRNLEAELDAKQRRHQETLKNLRKNELRLKEMTFQSDEDHKKQERLQELVEKLQLKIKSHKTQSEASAASIADDLRQEHDKNAHLEKNLEETIRDFQRRLDEVETGALKAGKHHLQKLETRVRDLKAGLDAEQRRHQETLKNLRKNELRLKEMTFQSDEDRKKQERLQELVEKLQLKIKSHKTQSEASIDLTKAVYEMTRMSQDKQIKELQSALSCTMMEREIFKVLATARRKKEEEEEKHMSNGHMEEMAMRHHQEQARYLGQAWQEATSGTCSMHDPDDRNHHQHPG